MPFTLERRATPSPLARLAAPLLAVALTLAGGSVLFAALGHPPLAALYAFLVAPLGDLYGLGELCSKAAPIMLCAVGVAIGFRASVWNIGAEGQLILGAIASGVVALTFGASGSPLVLPAMVLAGVLGGMAWAAIPAFLKVRFNASEILVTLMLTYVAGLLLSALVYGPLRSPTGFNWPESSAFGPAARLPRLVPGTRLNIGFPIALLVALAAWFFIARTHLAFRMQVGALAPRAARYAGFSHTGAVWAAMLIGGAAAGLAGTLEVAGTIGKLREVVSPGYGYAAIIVAFIGRLHPVGIVLGSLLMALLYLGGENAKVALGIPAAATGIFQGLLLFSLLVSDSLVGWRVRWRSSPPVAREVADRG